MTPGFLVPPFTSLPLEDRDSALEEAREAGWLAAGGPVDPADLEAGRPMEYYLHVIAPLRQRDLIGQRSAAGWKIQCMDNRALGDPRVQAFLYGWHKRALQILGEASEEEDPRAEEVRRLLEASEKTG